MLASICVAMTAFASEGDAAFECPDDKALKFLEIAKSVGHAKSGFNDSISAFTYVIENASRPMDEVALRTACFGLAREFYVADLGGDPGSDLFGLVPPKDAVDSLRLKHTVLLNCDYHSLYDPQLPNRRGAYVPPKEAVLRGISGWVDLELDISDDGKVESARIVDSSNSLLEPGVVDHVLTFRYPARTHWNGQQMRRKGFQVRINTDYFQIARENGCRWDGA